MRELWYNSCVGLSIFWNRWFQRNQFWKQFWMRVCGTIVDYWFCTSERESMLPELKGQKKNMDTAPGQLAGRWKYSTDNPGAAGAIPVVIAKLCLRGWIRRVYALHPLRNSEVQINRMFVGGILSEIQLCSGQFSGKASGKNIANYCRKLLDNGIGLLCTLRITNWFT